MSERKVNGRVPSVGLGRRAGWQDQDSCLLGLKNAWRLLQVGGWAGKTKIKRRYRAFINLTNAFGKWVGGWVGRQDQEVPCGSVSVGVGRAGGSARSRVIASGSGCGWEARTRTSGFSLWSLYLKNG